jgi:hypothetical protein
MKFLLVPIRGSSPDFACELLVLILSYPTRGKHVDVASRRAAEMWSIAVNHLWSCIEFGNGGMCESCGNPVQNADQCTLLILISFVAK